MRANVEFDDGVITYVGPREPAGAAIDITGKVLRAGLHRPHTHPWCLYSPTSLLEVAVPDGTTTLVYDNLFFFLSHGVDGLRAIVDQMRAAPAHIRAGGADLATVGLSGRGVASATAIRN